MRFAATPGYVGRLHGPYLPGNHRYCVRFYYLLQASRKVDNALILYIYDEHNVAVEKVWSLSYNSKSVWTQVEITFMKPMLTKVPHTYVTGGVLNGRRGERFVSSAPLQLVFASICRNFWECGLVAIDDISVSLGDCQITAGEPCSLHITSSGNTWYCRTAAMRTLKPEPPIAAEGGRAQLAAVIYPALASEGRRMSMFLLCARGGTPAVRAQILRGSAWFGFPARKTRAAAHICDALLALISLSWEEASRRCYAS